MMFLVAAINVVVFATGLAWLTNTFQRYRVAQDEEVSDLLAERVQYLVDPKGVLNTAGILQWSHWDKFDDAIIVRVPSVERAYRRQAAYLNPVGSSHRAADFPEDEIMADIRTAVIERRKVSSTHGVVTPVYDADGEVWGGCWQLLPQSTFGAGELFRYVAPWFVVSTLFLTLVTVAALRRFVLDPVRELALGAGRIGGAELGFRVKQPRGHNEISALVRGFNAMADEVEGFSDRLRSEVDVATDKARRAEAAAMTQRRLAATGGLAAGIAHEINNPLGGMLNALEVLERDQQTPEKRAEYLALLKNGLERIGTTVGQILHLAPRETRTEAVELAAPIGDALGLVAHRAREQSVEIWLHAEPDSRRYENVDSLVLWSGLPSVIGQANELGQAVLNLLVNSLDALEAGDGGRIDISLSSAGEELRLLLYDDGPGMDAELLEHAADLFYTTKDTGKGTGLGLAIAHNVVSNHGGRVLLTSDPGVGFQVEILLPIAGSTVSGALKLPTDRATGPATESERGA
ncbi:MAG: signal transduction histidine kinase [Chlamydiales bacterium]|jgi:signal transduction histidine kinase